MEIKQRKKEYKPGDMPFYKIVLFILVPSAVFGVIGWLLKGVTSEANPHGLRYFGSDSTDAFIFACIPSNFLLWKFIFQS
jgi:proton-dependent oligopeptide transporter, POT family